VLSCETRLELLRLLFEKGELCVSELARLTGTTSHNASTQLRALNARGLISPRREKLRVIYRAEANAETASAPVLLEALRAAFTKKTPIRTIFHICTAFTHPRRIEIARSLTKAPQQTFGEMLDDTAMSSSALATHLEKLLSRGFVKKREGRYGLVRLKDPLRRVLLQAACE
jgi:DNA-binding transcriptional ArsR family regulator